MSDSFTKFSVVQKLWFFHPRSSYFLQNNILHDRRFTDYAKHDVTEEDTLYKTHISQVVASFTFLVNPNNILKKLILSI